jgi:uncharacterized protein YdhG (YjbR/CyaY superfamily)
MDSSKPIPETIDQYISLYPQEVQEKLQTIRRVIQEEAPEAKEKIAYAIPTFTFHGNLVHFAGYKNHIGFYPAPSGIEQFPELQQYKTGKGTIQFPVEEELPLDLIRKVVRFRVQENLAPRKKK